MKTIGSSVALVSRVDDNEVVGGVDAVERGAVSRPNVLKKSAKSKSWTKSDKSNNSEKPKFLTSEAKQAFNRLKQAFTKVPILQHFDLKSHIRIETNASSYAIERVLSQLTPNQVTSNKTIGSNVDWHPLTYFSKKMIPAKIQCKTHNGELLAIVEAFKTWQH